ncbi:PREDICTED: uncharacterized protein LOC109243742 [Nicotiana attenuata]|uniref:uncharacterized protein LOC109243742 n=1 Tax=Nicotiana attenuata TaxID=49451 RepID=UPI000904FF22|nr:PREDICTED: uncharacterized protein LOC109243742 [Nicotiana attenuata]
MPKWTFNLRLAILDRLATKERLARWSKLDDTVCSLCNRSNETVQHLFFECDTTWELWQKILQWQGIVKRKKQWHEEIQWTAEKAAGKSAGAELYRVAMAAVVYHVWQARNRCIFQKEKFNVIKTVKMVVQEIHIRAQCYEKLDKCGQMPLLGSSFRALNFASAALMALLRLRFCDPRAQLRSQPEPLL